MYKNWELSADRANAARRLMSQSGLSANQIIQVRGFADQRLRKPKDPLDPPNRRISLIVQYESINPTATPSAEEGKAEGNGKPSAKEDSEPKSGASRE